MLRRVVTSGVVQGHVELVAESGVVSIVRTCQRVVELHEIHCREWSRRAALLRRRLRESEDERRRFHRMFQDMLLKKREPEEEVENLRQFIARVGYHLFL